MKREVINVINMPDIKSEGGMWLRYYSQSESFGKSTVYHTRSGRLWNSVLNRTKLGGSHQRDEVTYEGSTNDFESFQQFSVWCQSQHGYQLLDENGKLWQLDKDLLVLGNMSYSVDTCMFVPARINSLFLAKSRVKISQLPQGVSEDRRVGHYQAKSKGVDKRYINLGVFSCPFEAHIAWQRHKMEVIKELPSLYDLGEKLELALARIYNKISMDVMEGRMSKF